MQKIKLTMKQARGDALTGRIAIHDDTVQIIGLSLRERERMSRVWAWMWTGSLVESAAWSAVYNEAFGRLNILIHLADEGRAVPSWLRAQDWFMFKGGEIACTDGFDRWAIEAAGFAALDRARFLCAADGGSTPLNLDNCPDTAQTLAIERLKVLAVSPQLIEH